MDHKGSTELDGPRQVRPEILASDEVPPDEIRDTAHEAEQILAEPELNAGTGDKEEC